eukprot:CAMPEP_0114996634 /NCGR_PEP_ID=MMETSP0216-20121206/14434_1 /TAXON_ID=223996 /ORGANISM="Protocruzia adherens, Strain Boccale" /LENGTH=220 /DNA_ID=CAMNT_0002360889 /DNA_START=126 /DNA_END=788 /DNA_ORIENTATION=-
MTLITSKDEAEKKCRFYEEQEKQNGQRYGSDDEDEEGDDMVPYDAVGEDVGGETQEEEDDDTEDYRRGGEGIVDEEEDEFLMELEAMRQDAAQNAQKLTKGELRLPTNVKFQQNPKISDIHGPKRLTKLPFKLVTKKGNKVAVRDIEIPRDCSLASVVDRRVDQEEKEREDVKRRTLDLHDRDVEMERKNGPHDYTQALRSYANKAQRDQRIKRENYHKF